MASPEVNSLFEAFWKTIPPVKKAPTFKSKKDVDYSYDLIPGFVKTHISWNNNEGIIDYSVIEPEFNSKLKETYGLIEIGLQELISINFIQNSKDTKMRDFLEANVKSILVELGVKLTSEEFLNIMYYVFRNFIGLNKIEPLMRDPYIEDIECNGAGYSIYIAHRFFETMKTNLVFNDEELTNFVEKLAQRCGRYISFAKPVLDGSLPDGSRVNATYTSDITTRGPTFTIRKFSKDPWTPTKIISVGSASAEIYAYLWIAAEHKLNMMVIGETSAGKTTFLNSIGFFIRPEARIVSIEDTRELNLPHENWLPGVEREGFQTGAKGTSYGAVSLFDLLKASFRQNPDYVIIGEVRGVESYVLFQGMASGHPSLGTFHAGSVEMLLRRLETNPINLPPSLIQSLDIVVHAIKIGIGDRNVRRLMAVYEIKEIKEEIGKADYERAFEFYPKTDTFSDLKSTLVFEKISRLTKYSVSELIEEHKRRTDFLKKLVEEEIFYYTDFAKEIEQYYGDPEYAFRLHNMIYK